MIDKFTQSIDTLFVVINGSVDELLQVFQPAFCFIGALGAQRLFVTGFLNRIANDVRNRRIGVRVSIRIGELREMCNYAPETFQRRNRAGAQIFRLLDDGCDRFPPGELVIARAALDLVDRCFADPARWSCRLLPGI